MEILKHARESILDGGTSAQSSLANTSHVSTVWKTILTRDLADIDNAVAYKGR